MDKLPNFQHIGEIFLGRLHWVISNSKFRSFQVQIMIQKDNTDDKVLEKNFHIK